MNTDDDKNTGKTGPQGGDGQGNGDGANNNNSNNTNNNAGGGDGDQGRPELLKRLDELEKQLKSAGETLTRLERHGRFERLALSARAIDPGLVARLLEEAIGSSPSADPQKALAQLKATKPGLFRSSINPGGLIGGSVATTPGQRPPRGSSAGTSNAEREELAKKAARGDRTALRQFLRSRRGL